MNKAHFTNAGIKENKTFSVNILSEDKMLKMDYVGLVSGKETDKSGVFDTFFGKLKTAPIISDCPVSMECRLHDIYDIGTHDVFIGEIVATYVDEAVLTNGRIDLATRRYWTLGSAVGDCWSVGKALIKK
jgi:flavin reductase (DIM6/NTAB) family NADH-FMN oxidoreductase RutF